jgi:Flp pilus assembly protein TadG
MRVPAHAQSRATARRAATVVELAIVLPFLLFLFVIAIDYARIFYYGVILENCARNGAYYASDYPNANYVYNDIYGYKNLDEAVYKDAVNISPQPKYTVTYSASLNGTYGATPVSSGYAQVTLTWTFNTITRFPGVPSSVDMKRSVIMKMSPVMPNF